MDFIRNIYGCQLSQLRGRCVKANEMVLVPVTNLFVAGFSCTSRSKRNNSRAKFSHCIALGTECETSGTFDDNLEYIKSCKPKVVILENVPELMK